MPKLYYPTPDEVQGAEPLNELVWFERYQHLLVKLANTDWGRDLLLIDKYPYPVVAIGKNYVRFHLGVWDDQDHYLSDFRVGAKWGNIIRYRWLEVVKAIDRIILESILSYPSVYYRGRRLHPVGGGATTTVYPDPHAESTTVDGYVGRHTGGSETWSEINGGAGDAAGDNDASAHGPRVRSSTDSGNPWNFINHHFTLFDTSSIGSTTVESATWSFVVTSSVVDELSISLSLFVTSPATNTALVNADYQQIGTTKQATDITYASVTANNTTYNDMALTVLTNIDASGVTKLGVTNSGWKSTEPSYISDKNSYLNQFIFAETSGTSKDPKLVIIHTSPFTAKVIVF